MFPGFVSKVSESALALSTTIAPLTDLVRITDTTSTTAVATISPPYGGFGGIMFVHNSSGNNITTVTTGNILNAVTIANNVCVVFIYSMVLNKFIVGAIS